MKSFIPSILAIIEGASVGIYPYRLTFQLYYASSHFTLRYSYTAWLTLRTSYELICYIRMIIISPTISILGGIVGRKQGQRSNEYVSRAAFNRTYGLLMQTAVSYHLLRMVVSVRVRSWLLDRVLLDSETAPCCGGPKLRVAAAAATEMPRPW